MIINVISKIRKFKKNTQLIFMVACVVCCGFSVFPTGIFNQKTLIQDVAAEASLNIEKTSDTGFASIQVIPTDNEAVAKMPRTYDEYFYWKYIFRNSDFGFLSTLNGAKNYNFSYVEAKNKNNITFLTCGNNHNNRFNDYYKHEVYDLFLMFEGRNVISSGAVNFISLPISIADEILISRGVIPFDNDSYSISQYESLIGTNTPLVMDDVEYLFTISNIFFEDGIFFSNVRNNFGSFALTYIQFPDKYKIEASYIFNTYTYQNMHRIERMRTYFGSGNFIFRHSLYNLKTSQFGDNFDYRIFNDSFNSDWASIILTILCFLLFAFVLYVIYMLDVIHDKKSFIIVGLFLLIPYLVLSLVNSFIDITLLFSYYSLTLYVIMIVSYIVFAFCVLFKEWRGLLRNNL